MTFLSGTVKLTRNTTSRNGQGIAFHGYGLWSFSNGFPQTVLTFGVDNSLSKHSKNVNSLYVLGEESTDDINNKAGEPEKSLALI